MRRQRWQACNQTGSKPSSRTDQQEHLPAVPVQRGQGPGFPDQLPQAQAGVLHLQHCRIGIENQACDRLQNGSNVQELDSESVEIIEIYSAPYQFVQPKYQMRFCEFLKASTPGELYQWGRGR